MTADAIRRLEELTLNSSSALQQMLYDGWLLRFSPGSQVKRSNSVSALYPSSLPLADKLDYCEAAYARAGLPTRFRIHEYVDPPDLDARLAERAYKIIEPTWFMSLPLAAEARPLTEDDRSVTSVSVKELPLPDWLEINHLLRGNAKETVAAHRARLTSVPLPCFPVALLADEEPVAVGLGFMQDGAFGLFDIFTAAAHRKRGHGHTLALALLAIARRERAAFAYLQAEESNSPAKAIYEGLGFRPVYRYWYRIKD